MAASLSSSVALMIFAMVALTCSEPIENKNQFRLKRFSSSRSPFANLLSSRAGLLTTGRLSLPGGPGADLGRPKRAMFDDSCKGVYDRQLFSKLDRVCEDCYNLYRKTSVSYECRTDCYGNPVFESCLYDLMLHDMVDKYAEMVQVVGRK